MLSARVGACCGSQICFDTTSLFKFVRESLFFSFFENISSLQRRHSQSQVAASSSDNRAEANKQMRPDGEGNRQTNRQTNKQTDRRYTRTDFKCVIVLAVHLFIWTPMSRPQLDRYSLLFFARESSQVQLDSARLDRKSALLEPTLDHWPGESRSTLLRHLYWCWSGAISVKVCCCSSAPKSASALVQVMNMNPLVVANCFALE